MFRVRIQGRGGQGVVTAAEPARNPHGRPMPVNVCAAECPCGVIQMEPEEV